MITFKASLSRLLTSPDESRPKESYCARTNLEAMVQLKTPDLPATHVAVILERRAHAVMLIIEDNGIRIAFANYAFA